MMMGGSVKGYYYVIRHITYITNEMTKSYITTTDISWGQRLGCVQFGIGV